MKQPCHIRVKGQSDKDAHQITSTFILHLTCWSSGRLCTILSSWHSLSLRQEATQKCKCLCFSKQCNKLKRQVARCKTNENKSDVRILCRLKFLCLMDGLILEVWHPQALQPSLPRSAGYSAVQSGQERTAPTSLIL